MLSSFKVAKKYMPVYCFHGKHFTCWDLHYMLETDNFGRRIGNRLQYVYSQLFKSASFAEVRRSVRGWGTRVERCEYFAIEANPYW